MFKDNDATVSSEAQLKALRRLAEDRVKVELEAEEGTAAVKVSGGLEDEVQIQVDQQKLSQLGISIGQIAERIRAENVNLSGGRLEEGNQRFLVRTLNEFQDIDEFRDAIVAHVAGQPVYLRDVATVQQGYKDREAITRVKGQESVELAIYKEGDANTVQVAERIRERLESLRKKATPKFSRPTARTDGATSTPPPSRAPQRSIDPNDAFNEIDDSDFDASFGDSYSPRESVQSSRNAMPQRLPAITGLVPYPHRCRNSPRSADHNSCPSMSYA